MKSSESEISSTNPTSYIANLLLLQKTLRTYDIDVDELLEKVGLDVSIYQNSSQRVPAEAMDELISLAIEKTGDPAFSLRVTENLNPVNYHALGPALLYSSNMREFCQRFARYFALISTAYKVAYEETDDYGCLKFWAVMEGHELSGNFDSDCFAAFLLKFIRLMYKPDYVPLKVKLIWTPDSKRIDQYRNYFSCELEFSAPVSAFYVEAKDLDVPLAASNIELARQNDQVVVDFLARMGKADLPSRVFAKIVELLPSGECNRNRVASALNMSASGFHEKLAKEGVSYQELLDKTRNSLAESYMQRSELSISEIAYMLGFTDSSNFSRAFKQWTEISPREYRKNLKH